MPGSTHNQVMRPSSATHSSATGASSTLAPIEALIPQIQAAGDQIDAQRCLPDELVYALKTAGGFRSLIPKQFGGLEADFVDYLKMVENLAAADASTAWCVNQATVIGLTSLWLPAAQIHEIWADPNTSVANGPPFAGTIEPHGDGYRLNGHWGFSSGCQHAVWMMGAARYSEGGWRIAYFRPQDVSFIDNWQVGGLRGTGSFEFTIKDLDLPSSQVADVGMVPTWQGALTTVPGALLFAMSFAAVALGVSRGALEDVIEIAQSKLPRYASLHLRDDPDVHRFVAKAQARWRSSRAYLHTTMTDVLRKVTTQGDITNHERSELRMAGTHVIRECAEVMDLAYKVAGSTGIYKDQPIHRRYQDMQVITQHVQARESHFALLGRYAVSGDYETGPMS